MTDQPPFDFDAATEPVARRLSIGLAKIGMAMKSRAWRDAGPARLTPTQGQALVALRNARPERFRAKREPVRVKKTRQNNKLEPGSDSIRTEKALNLRLDEVAGALGVTAPTASDAVTALVAKGLVRRDRAPDDRRATALKLTPAGAALADRVAGWPDFLAPALDALDLAEQTAFLRSLTKIIRGLQQAGDIAPQRLCVSCRYFRPNAHADRDRPHHCAFVDAPFGDRHLRLDCPEQEPVPDEQNEALWQRWAVPARPDAGIGGHPR